MAESQAQEPTVFVIDDDASVRKSICRLLGAVGIRSETFASAEEFLARELYGGVGCIVLDIRMPGLTGMDLQDELSKADCPLPVIFITGHGSIPVGVTAMKKGAVDFLSKPVEPAALLQAVRQAIEKDRKSKAEWAKIVGARRSVMLLTPREIETLRYVITGMLNKQIAFKLGIAERTVKAHRGSVMEKLQVNSLADLVRLAKKAGIGVWEKDFPDSSE